MLRLEPAPIVSSDINKGKRIVFDYGANSMAVPGNKFEKRSDKLFVDASKASLSVCMDTEDPQTRSTGVFERLGAFADTSVVKSSSGHASSTVHRTGVFQSCSSGTSVIKKYKRKRPAKNYR